MGQNRGRGGTILTPNKLVFPLEDSYVCAKSETVLSLRVAVLSGCFKMRSNVRHISTSYWALALQRFKDCLTLHSMVCICLSVSVSLCLSFCLRL